MRLVSFATADGPRAGLLRDGRVYDVGGEASPGELRTGCSREGASASSSRATTRPRGARAAAADRAARKDPLHRPQLPRPRGGGGPRVARDADDLRQVRQRAAARRRDRRAAALELEGRLRGRGGVRDRRPLQGRPGRRGNRPRRRLHALQRPVRARLPVQDAAVDAGQGLRRRGTVRPGARDARRGRTARRDRDRAALERRADAGELDRRPRPLDSASSWPTSRC